MTSQPDHSQPGQATLPGDAAPAVSTEIRILLNLGISPEAVARARAAVAGTGGTIAGELMRSRMLRPTVWWRAVAQGLGLRYFHALHLEARPLDVVLPDARFFQKIRQVWYRQSSSPIVVVAPLGREIESLALDLAYDPSLGRRIAIASPGTIRRAFREAHEAALTHQAVNQLRASHPDMSAADGMALRRRTVGGVILITVLAVFCPLIMLAAFNLVFLLTGGLRLASSLALRQPTEGEPLADVDLPTYAVLIPLYREAGVIADLVEAMQRIDYPRHRLAIYLIVEADDDATLAAAVAATVGNGISVIAVPPSHPRTKPKALVWALPFVDAELLTVYDAEDRPAPDQLRRAAAAFAAAPPDVVCLQAILEIDHASSSANWLVRQFALEYRVLFRAVLPWLTMQGLFLPLGGTSNHFRRDALLEIGAWDPFNVTEDADIAVRISRAGLSIGMLDSVTREEAPLTWRAWHLQRTRWMKGWLQTWLVHMRHPNRLFHEMGAFDFATLQIVILGQILSALAYPFGIALIVCNLTGISALFADRSFSGDLLLAFQVLALGCGWLGASAALLATTEKTDHMAKLRDLLTVPVYWFLLFGAAIHAIAELIVEPHRWNKTTHGIAERDPQAEDPPGT